MPKKTQLKDRNYIQAIPLPYYGEDSKYAIVEHTKAIDLIEKYLNNNGYSIKNEMFKINNGGNVVMGKLILGDIEHDMEMECQILFLNSYDKTQRFKLTAGLIHRDSGNSFILGNSAFGNVRRKHIGTANKDIEEAVENVCMNLNEEFNMLIKRKEALKNIILDRRDIILILGELYIDCDLIKDTQMAIIKRELDNSKFNYNCHELSAWHLYMTITHALAESSGKDYYFCHQKLYNYFEENEHRYNREYVPEQRQGADKTCTEDMLTIQD